MILLQVWGGAPVCCLWSSAKRRDSPVAGWSTGLWVRRKKMKMTGYLGLGTCSCSSRIEEIFSILVMIQIRVFKNSNVKTFGVMLAPLKLESFIYVCFR